ncbi:MAG: 2-hydroxyglutaryl-CoA dehydratase [Dehalococcoidia bacterium]|nr:MAG: 2-hydroxyglutaryl-CoA dehydratase [Dehalococcoidia bacterium]
MSSYMVAGVDIGSTTVKALLLKEGEIIGGLIGPTGTNPALAGKQILDKVVNESSHIVSDVKYIVATGYGRVSAPFADKTITEITCHGRGAHHISPQIRTVIDIGGQDAKVVSMGENGKVIDFVMNDKCASGTGRFLESAAQLVLHVPLEDLGDLSSKATNICKISSTCTVFAQTEIVSLLASGESKENVIAGLHSSIANRVIGMAKRVGVKPVIMMTGGVAKNIGVKNALENDLNTEVIIPSDIDPQLVGALGAALIADEIFTVGRGGG